MGHTVHAREGVRLTPAEAFSVVGNETRLAILQVLFEEKYGPPLTFSALRKRVGMRDGSQFNYHLKQLEGPFIKKSADGYAIRLAGIHVILTVVRGSFTDHPRIAPFETGGTCVECDRPLSAEYDEESVYVRCPSCESVQTMGMLPPGAIENRTDDEVLDAFDRRQRHDFALASNGVCTACAGTVTPRLIRNSGEMQLQVSQPQSSFAGFDFGIRYQCDRCDVWEFGTAGYHLLTHPAVVAFHRDHGVDLDSVPYWELDWVVSNRRTSVVDEDPLEVRVCIPLGGEVLRATLDETFAVVAVERTVAPHGAADSFDSPSLEPADREEP